VDLAKLEAIDRSGLGKKEDNIETIADLQAKKLGIEANIVKIEAKLITTERRIKDLTKQIGKQAEKIESMKTLDQSPTIGEEEQKEEEVETPSMD